MGLWAATAQMWDARFGASQRGTLGACKVGYVYDGDTVALICGSEEKTARIVGLDTAETKEPGCVEELAHGKAATQRLRGLIANGKTSYRHLGHDKYGRELIRLTVDDVDVATTLVSEELAVAYRGGTRPDWCAKLRE